MHVDRTGAFSMENANGSRVSTSSRQRTNSHLLEWYQKLKEQEQLLWLSGWSYIVFSLFLALCMSFDQRTILGINVWIKPLKFTLSAWIYIWTIGWMLAQLRVPTRTKAILRWSLLLTILLEVVLVSTQSARGIPSHFNHSTTLNTLIFNTMGVAIAWNTIIAIDMFRRMTKESQVNPALWSNRVLLWGVRWGLLLFLAGSVVGGLMARKLQHTVGAVDGGAGLPFLNWSTVAGDLRVAHFFGLHALQLLPILGWWMQRRTTQTIWIHGMAGLYALWVGWTLFQAWIKMPLLSM
jgi:hypothetical protein